MTSDATHLPGDVLLARRQYMKLPPGLSTPEHEAIAFLIWLDLQREGRAVAPAIEAFGVTVEEWRTLARLVGRHLGQNVGTRSDSTTSETVARIKGWPVTDRDRAMQRVLTGGAGAQPSTGAKPAARRARRDSTRDAREKFVDAADQLYVEHGMNAVGIDLVIKTAGGTKATFYKYFRSHDLLMATILRRRHDVAVDDLARIEARGLAPVDALREFVNGLASPVGADLLLHAVGLFRPEDHPARVVAVAHREWRLAELGRLTAAAGASSSEEAAAELSAALDGASIMRHNGQPDRAAQALTRALSRAL